MVIAGGRTPAELVGRIYSFIARAERPHAATAAFTAAHAADEPAILKSLG
jgi:hypothetical protein